MNIYVIDEHVKLYKWLIQYCCVEAYVNAMRSKNMISSDNIKCTHIVKKILLFPSTYQQTSLIGNTRTY